MLYNLKGDIYKQGITIKDILYLLKGRGIDCTYPQFSRMLSGDKTYKSQQVYEATKQILEELHRSQVSDEKIKGENNE